MTLKASSLHNRRSERPADRAEEFTTAMSPDLSTYPLFLVHWNPAFPMLIYVPITVLL